MKSPSAGAVFFKINSQLMLIAHYQSQRNISSWMIRSALGQQAEQPADHMIERANTSDKLIT